MASPKRGRRAVAWVVVLAQLGWTITGCVSVRTRGDRALEGQGGGVSVQVFANDAARRAGQPGPTGLVGELERQEGRTWRPVFRSLDPSWTVLGLPPGKYRVGFPARLTDAGDVERLATPRQKVFTVREGRMTEVQVTLKHISPVLVAAGVVTVVVAAVLISAYLDDLDIPKPPLPPPELAELVFYLSLDVAEAAWMEGRDRAAPFVTSHFPASNAVVAARRPKVIFCFSEPLAGHELEPEAVVVLGEKSGLIEGSVTYDPVHWWVVWTPGRELPAGDRFHITLAGDAIEDVSGNEPGKATSFSFQTAP